jgi:hypothetical protein
VVWLAYGTGGGLDFRREKVLSAADAFSRAELCLDDSVSRYTCVHLLWPWPLAYSAALAAGGLAALSRFQFSIHRNAESPFNVPTIIPLGTILGCDRSRHPNCTIGPMVVLVVGLAISVSGWEWMRHRDALAVTASAQPGAPNVLLIVLDTVLAQSLKLIE